MDELPSQLNIQASQPAVINTEKPRLDYLPGLWDAAGAIVSPDLVTRSDGLRRLVEADAVRSHSLIAYLLFSRLTEPDIELRSRIVAAVADVLLPGVGREPENNPAFDGLITWLAEMRTRQIYSLLETGEFDKNAEPYIAVLLENCSYAGEHLAEILANRQMPLSIRKQAAYYVARVGYMDALPVLERMAGKLEQRRNGREELGEPLVEGDECNLLPLIRSALGVLTAP